ncbi:MAG: ribbon-helix-helix protein, CopG family [Deltaproteobacteria bacterium]|nr:ribbon-helix-helix protein, CopG family [Deltaproteobacteria bacterium]
MRITVHVPDTLGPKLKQAARNEGVSVSAFAAKALEEYLRRTRKRVAGNRLLKVIRPGSVPPDTWEELEQVRADDRA